MKALLPKLIAVGLAVFVLNVSAETHYVDLNSPNPTPPYTNWTMAATNIQDAVDVATVGDTVLATNGVYATGGRRWFDSGTNLVTVTNALMIQSVNGPAFTVIQGHHAPGTNAVRCVLLTANAVLSGFTLTNGQSGIANYPNGGGVHCYSSNAIISNCVLVGNLANDSGGGAYRGTLVNCSLKGNSATNSGGGAYNSILVNCALTGNSARDGGGAFSGTMTNCLVVGNSAATGGGAFTLNNDHLYNCTIVSNTATSGRGGVYEGVCQNCIIYYNSAPIYPNGLPLSVFYCCMTPLQSGPGNFTNAPLFVDPAGSNYQLQSNSPCINAGKNAYITSSFDLGVGPRIAGGTVDMGAYEFPSPSSVLSYAWAQQYGLPTDGTADLADTDGDGANNWMEWRADTIPTNTLSVLRMVSATNSPTGARVTWQSVATRSYSLQRATNLGAASPFQIISNNIVGASGTKTVTDPSATNSGPYFYRVGVQ